MQNQSRAPRQNQSAASAGVATSLGHDVAGRLRRAWFQLRHSDADIRERFSRWHEQISGNAYSAGWAECYVQCVATVEDECGRGGVPEGAFN